MADDDAAAFVFGQDRDRVTEPSPQPKPESKPQPSKPTAKKSRAIDKLMKTAEQERQVRITVDLAASQHQELTLASAKLGKSKAEIIRALVDDFLSELND
ncbi:MAG: plasmid partition protein ParG [Thainema sp.]